MNNSEVNALLVECQDDLVNVKSIVDSLRPTDNAVPYLGKYALIKACGTIEVAYKATIADHCSKRAEQQLKNFINKRIRDSSSNPSFSNICSTLKDFDEAWNEEFKNLVKSRPDGEALRTSLQSLVDGRNDFSHGGNPSLTIMDVLKYYQDSCVVIGILDSVVS